MILVLKHLVLMSVALLAVPFAGLFFARAVARSRRMRRPGFSWGLLAWRIAVALAVPIVAQGLFVFCDGRWPLEARYLALALAGAIYGATFGNDEDFPLVPSTLWGVVGGLGAAWLYNVLPASGEGRALCVATFAVFPFLAYRPLGAAVRKRLTSGGVIVPSRRLLR